MSALPLTATPLLSPRSSSSRLMRRQSGASDGVVMVKILPAFPFCRKMFYTARQPATRSGKAGRAQVAEQGVVRETACAVVEKLRSGEVTPLDLLDVLEQRIAEVDGKVNAL